MQPIQRRLKRLSTVFSKKLAAFKARNMPPHPGQFLRGQVYELEPRRLLSRLSLREPPQKSKLRLAAQGLIRIRKNAQKGIYRPQRGLCLKLHRFKLAVCQLQHF